jgi:N-acetylneuraminate synthase
MNIKKHTYIVAEAGVNHNGSLDLAKKLVDVAVDANADAVKFQTFKAEALVSDSAPKAHYQKRATGARESQLEMLRKLELDVAAHRDLATYCRMRGIQFLSSPFDEDSINLLVGQIGIPIIKIPSGEITNAPLLLHAARTRKPIILSTGMSTLAEVRIALGVLAFGYTRQKVKPSLGAFRNAYRSQIGRGALKTKVTLLHCATEYPAPFHEINLCAMQTMRTAFSLPVGFSDHTTGIAISIAAVALGASVIEKHFTLDRSLPGPDHRASLEPNELCQMVKSIREVEVALGSGKKTPTRSELKNIPIVRKSLVALKDIVRGEPFTAENLGFKRPGIGASPFKYWQILGKEADRNYRKGDMIKA